MAIKQENSAQINAINRRALIANILVCTFLIAVNLYSAFNTSKVAIDLLYITVQMYTLMSLGLMIVAIRKIKGFMNSVARVVPN